MSAPHGLLPSTCPSSGSSPLEGLLAPLRFVMACEMREAQVLHSLPGYLGPKELLLQLSFLPEEQDFQGTGGRGQVPPGGRSASSAQWRGTGATWASPEPAAVHLALTT